MTLQHAPPGGDPRPAVAERLTVSGLSKTFPGQRALKDVDFAVAAGEVHALIGQNGSGKSTLIKVLAGYHKPDPGAEAAVDGRPFKLGDAASAFEAGLRFVHQDLGLVGSLGAIDNLALGRGYHRGRTGTISWRREAEAGREVLHGLGYDFDLRTPVDELSAAERTGIAIARALEGWSGAAKVLVLDEPTASLPAAEVQRLFDVIRMVSDNGVSVIYVSHRFGEVFETCDRVTVLRDGVRVATRETSELTHAAMVELTIGRELQAFEAAHAISHSARPGEPVLSVAGLTGTVVDGMDLAVHPGEIVGVAGVTGSGREEVADLIGGALPRGGELLVDGQPVPQQRPDVCVRRGMALVPAQRLTKAALADMTLRENVTIGGLDPFYDLRGLRRRAERAETERWLRKLGVVPQDAEARFATLSGGNQQKVIIARALRLEPRVLVLDEPTQGVDVGAKAAIHAIIEEAAAGGAGVLVLSTESEELVALCDRIVVLVDGRVTRTCAAADLSAGDLTELTMRPGSPR